VDGLREEAARLLRAHALLDFGAACVIAAASGATQGGVRVGGSCVLLTVFMAAAAAGLTVYYAVVRPFAARLEVAVATAQAGTLTVLCGLTLGAVASGGTAVSSDALEAVGLAAEAVTFGAPVVLVVPVVWNRLCGGGRSEGTLPAKAGAAPVAGSSGKGDTAVSAPLLTVPRHAGRNAPQREQAERTRGGGDGDAASVHRSARSNPLVAARRKVHKEAAVAHHDANQSK
jgi:hypothetical protein